MLPGLPGKCEPAVALARNDCLGKYDNEGKDTRILLSWGKHQNPQWGMRTGLASAA